MNVCFIFVMILDFFKNGYIFRKIMGDMKKGLIIFYFC